MEKQFYTLESSQVTTDFTAFDFDNNMNGSPISVYYSADNNSFELKQKLKELEISLLGPESDIVDSCQSFSNGSRHKGVSQHNWSEIAEMIPKLDLKEVLITCAQAVS
ncbi:scarecrow-like protein 13-like, partial [Trifolium medium]|nr:scarecrow-like protein 13-like [Trifolium medium]